MGSALIGIEEHLTLAREYALLGNYDSALIFFEGVHAQIIKYATMTYIFVFTSTSKLQYHH